MRTATTDFIDEKTLDNVYSALMPQNRLILEVCEATGLRISDVLKMKSTLKQRGTITEKKTGKRRNYYIPKNLYAKMLEQAGEFYIFEHAKDTTKHKTRQAVWYDIKRAQKLFRLKENIAPHTLRKCYAVAQYNKSGDLQRVKRLLNHDSDYVTILYAMADELTKRKLQKNKRGR